MAFNLMSLFGGRRQAVDEALRQSEQMRMREVGNNVAAGAARSNVNPLALARTLNSAQTDERNQMAQQRAAMMAQARLQEGEDITGLIGAGLSTIGNIAGLQMPGAQGGGMGGLGQLIGLGGGAIPGMQAVAPVVGAMTQGMGGGAMSQVAGGVPGLGQMLGSPGPDPNAPVPVQSVGPAAQALTPQLTQQIQSGLAPRPQQPQVPASPMQAATPAPQPNPASQTMLPERNREQQLTGMTQNLGMLPPLTSLRMLMGR